MELLNFINSNDNWQTILTTTPYNLKISYEGPYILLKYQQFISDMSLKICQEARGTIFRQDGNGKYVPISIAMYKFFNATEPYAAITHLDWSSAIISEKIDGSLMRLAYDNIDNYWLLSSNGTIFARNVTVADTNFEKIFIDILGGENQYQKLLNNLDKDYCYFFEMVSPYNVICVHYKESAIYFLGRRNMITFQEDNCKLDFENIKHPHIYKLFSLSDCYNAANDFKSDFEGFVVCDKNYNRVKIKTPWYIALHKIRGNGALTVLRVVEMWQSDSLDDFIAYYPEFNKFVTNVANSIKNLVNIADLAFSTINNYKDIESRRDFARYANTYIQPLRAYLFARLDNKTANATEFYKNMRARNLAAHIQTTVSNKEVGVADDE